jgi:hypothetical protein
MGLHRAGRQRNLRTRAKGICWALRAPQLTTPAAVSKAYGAAAAAAVEVVGEMNRQIATLEAEPADQFDKHPEAEIYHSLPGLGASWVLARRPSSATIRTAMPSIVPVIVCQTEAGERLPMKRIVNDPVLGRTHRRRTATNTDFRGRRRG